MIASSRGGIVAYPRIDRPKLCFGFLLCFELKISAERPFERPFIKAASLFSALHGVVLSRFAAKEDKAYSDYLQRTGAIIRASL